MRRGRLLLPRNHFRSPSAALPRRPKVGGRPRVAGIEMPGFGAFFVTTRPAPVNSGIAQGKTIFGGLIGLLDRAGKEPVFRCGWLMGLVCWVATPFATKPLVKHALILPLGLLVIAKAATVEGLQLRTYDGFGPIASQPLWLQAVEIYLRGGSDRLDPSPLPSAALVALSRSAPQFGKIRGTAALRGHSFRHQLHTEGTLPGKFRHSRPHAESFPRPQVGALHVEEAQAQSGSPH